MSEQPKISTIDRVNVGLAARYRKEKRFRLFGLSAIVASLLFLVLLLGSIVSKGYTAFRQTQILLDIHFDPAVLDVNNLATANYGALVRDAVLALYPGYEKNRDHMLAMQRGPHASYYGVMIWVLVELELWLRANT